MGPKDAINDVPIPALLVGAGILSVFALCLLLVRKPDARTKAFEKWGGVAGAWAVAIGYLIAHRRIVGRPELPPSGSMLSDHWLAYIAVLGALLATLKSLWRAPLWARLVARSALASLIAAAMLVPLMRSDWLNWFVWTERDAGLWFAGGVAGVIWIITGMGLLAKRTPAWSAWLAMSAMLGAMAPALAFWGVALDARLMGVLAAMSGAVFAVCAITRRKSFGAPITIALGALAGAITLHAASSGEKLNYLSLAVYMLAPFAWMLADLPIFNRIGKNRKWGGWGGWARHALRAALPALCGAAAAWIAYEPADYAGLGY